jgi:ribosomal protein S18 acetylase RimI-like enzyme
VPERPAVPDSSTIASELEIRPARREERECVARLIYGNPSQEAAALAGGAARAAALGSGLFLAGVGSTDADEIFLALCDGHPVGGLLARVGSSDLPLSLHAVLRALPILLKLFGPGELPGLVRRTRLRARLQFPTPSGAYHVVEVHVAPELRGAVIGSALLRHAEAAARRRGCSRLTLTTALSNPALRLYSRLGYVETARRSVAGYLELTGTEGRIFLEKLLDEGAAQPDAVPRGSAEGPAARA